MIDKVFNVLTNPSLVSTSQNTVAAVTIETGLKAAGRPAATLLDKHADKKTKVYSSAKNLILTFNWVFTIKISCFYEHKFLD